MRSKIGLGLELINRLLWGPSSWECNPASHTWLMSPAFWLKTSYQRFYPGVWPIWALTNLHFLPYTLCSLISYAWQNTFGCWTTYVLTGFNIEKIFNNCRILFHIFVLIQDFLYNDYNESAILILHWKPRIKDGSGQWCIAPIVGIPLQVSRIKTRTSCSLRGGRGIWLK